MASSTRKTTPSDLWESFIATCKPVVDPVFGSGRQVTGRAFPTMLMSMYAQDIFWDGRGKQYSILTSAASYGLIM